MSCRHPFAVRYSVFPAIEPINAKAHVGEAAYRVLRLFPEFFDDNAGFDGFIGVESD
jgi:hypothetical protein